jgi:hypothetical protein
VARDGRVSPRPSSPPGSHKKQLGSDEMFSVLLIDVNPLQENRFQNADFLVPHQNRRFDWSPHLIHETEFLINK